MNPANVLKNRNFARLFFAGAASIAGFSIGQVAISYFVFTSTHSPVDLAFVGVAFTLALVCLSLFGGTLADRQDRRTVMIICDAVRAGSLALVTSAFIFFGFNLWIVIITSFLLGAFSAVFQPAERAMIPSILEQNQLPDANGLIQLTASLAQAFSSALGGALVAAVGAVLAIGFNSITFLVSGLLLASLTMRKLAPTEVGTTGSPQRPSFLDDTREGIKYLLGYRALLMLTVSSGIINLFFAMMFPFFVIYTSEVLHGSASTYGIFLGLFALGAAPGALLVARVGAVKRAGYGWLLPWVVGGAALFTFTVVPNVIVAFVGIFVFGVSLGFAVTTWLTVVQVVVPSEMQGRYFGIDQLGSFAILPVGQVIGGFAVAAFGLSLTYEIAAAGMMITALAFLGEPSLRKLAYVKPEKAQTVLSSTAAV